MLSCFMSIVSGRSIFLGLCLCYVVPLILLIEVVPFALSAIIIPEQRNQQKVNFKKSYAHKYQIWLSISPRPLLFVFYKYSKETFQHSLPDFCKHCTYHTKYSIKVKGKLRCWWNFRNKQKIIILLSSVNLEFLIVHISI